MKLRNSRSRLTAFVLATGAVILDAGVGFAGEATVVPSHATGSAVAAGKAASVGIRLCRRSRACSGAARFRPPTACADAATA